MAEKQLAYRVSGKDELFADDDPLAELARIVGFEPRPPAPSAPVASRQEPAFDLEDELLREFERYDAPRLSPVDDIPVSPEDEPLYGEADYSRPANDVGPQAGLSRKSEPEFAELPPQPSHIEPAGQGETYEADSLEDSAFDWQVDETEILAPQQVAAEFEHSAPEPVASELPVSSYASHETAAPDERDLSEELELSIGAPAAQPSASARTPQWAAASIRLPLANFNAPRRQEAAPVEMAAPADVPAPVVHAPEMEAATIAAVADERDFEQSASLGFPAEQDRHEIPAADAPAEAVADEAPAMETENAVFDLAAAAEHGDVHADAALTEAAYAQTPSLDIDDLLADVSRYPVPQREPVVAAIEPAVEGAPVQQPVTPVLPAVSAAAPQPILERAQPVAERPQALPDNAAASDAEDPFTEQDFDFDLEGIELELADFDFTDQKPAPAAEPAARREEPSFAAAPQPSLPVRATPLPVAPAPARQASYPEVSVRPELSARPATAPILHAVAAVAAPVEARVAAPIIDTEQALPFDPSEISDTDDRVETFEGMHVPTLPPVEKDEPVAVPHEYDFDIDAEMASLFGAPAKANTPEQPRAAAVGETETVVNWSKPAAASAVDAIAKKPVDELDEFERALEEDFRRSVRESAQPVESHATRMTFESPRVVADRRSARSMRGLAVAAVAVIALGGGAYGAYNWLSHGGTSLGLSSGEPKIITADKEPVKVVPENPGGKVVPNQDKAVYDRVAGDATTAPKQKELVSSSEQPVDVVQKTLIPEAMSPDDGDGTDGTDVAGSSTPVGETEDPRLLPNQGGNVDTAATSHDDAPSVSPRKVRTMIVKPDGTLVAREDTDPVVDDTVKTSASPAKAAPALSPVSSSAAKQGSVRAPAAKELASADLHANPADDAPAAAGSPSALANTADGDAASADSTPIRVVKTTKVGDAKPAETPAVNTPAASSANTASAADTAPVPASRPAAAQPPKAAEHVETRPATAPVVQKPAPAAAQVASASPTTQPVKAAPAAAAGAGGYVVQIASLPSEDEAKRSQANLSAKFANVIGGHPIEVRKADVAGKGTYYRVRVVAGSKDDAAALCVRYRAAGGTCLISK